MGETNNTRLQSNTDSLKISLHNHFHFDRDYGAKDVFDVMIEEGINIFTIDGYEMPDIISDPFSDLIKIIEEDSLLKEEYKIGFIDSLALKVINKEKNKSIYGIRAKEIGTEEEIHLGFIGYNGRIKYGKPLEEMIDAGLGEGALVNLYHICAREKNAYKFWNDSKFIDDKTKLLIEKILKEKEGKICVEEFNAFLINFIPFFLDISEANKRAEDFLNELEKKGIKTPRSLGNDAHIKKKAHIKTSATVSMKMAVSDVDTTNGEFLRESIKNNFYENKYSCSEKKYVSRLNFWEGYGPDKLKSYWNNFISIFTKKRKRIGED